MKGFIGNTSSIGMLNRTRLVAYTSAVCLFVFVTLLAFPIAEISEDATAATGTALPSTTVLTLSSTNESSVVNVVTNSSQGTFAASDAGGTAEFSVTTNNFTGYTLSISSDDDTGRLENYTHDYISSIPTNTTEADFSSTNNTTYNNKWGFKPSSYVNNNAAVDNTGNNAVFLPSPTTTPTVLNVTSAANTTDDEYTLGLGIRADMLLPSGVYSKTLNLIALANVVSYTINFDANTADTTVTNMPSAASGTTSATGITIPNTTPARTNYTFEGWCSVISPTGQCNGNTYQPNGSFGIDQTTENVTTLYAVWKPTRTMQNVYSWMNDLAINDSIQATDTRDGKVYWVTKIETDSANPRAMIDQTTGKSYQIWMTQNLDYDLDSNTTLTPADSDVSADWTPVRSTVASDSLNSNTWQTDGTTPYSYDSGLMYYYNSGTSDNDAAFNGLEACVAANHSMEECTHYHSGNYYNWSATVANNDTSSVNTQGISMLNSVCPAGWTLPTRSTDYGDYGYLLLKNGVISDMQAFLHRIDWEETGGYTTDGFQAFRTSPLWFVRSGTVRESYVVDYQGEYARYYTNTVASGVNAYGISASGPLIAADSGNRGYGRTVRCVVKPTMQIATVGYLEEKLPNVGDTTWLADERDGKMYPITRIDDNNFWMTSNLDLAGGTTLTSADSNVANNYTLPASDIDAFNDNTVAAVYNSDSVACGSAPCYSYYNYVAATAGTNPTGDAEYDICPKGWRIPTYNEYGSLTAIYNTGVLLNDIPWNGLNNGTIYEEGFSNNGGAGYYWTSTAYDATSSIKLYYTDSITTLWGGGNKNGYGVRCIIKKPYMQDYSHSDLVSELPNTGDTRDLYDARDGKKYSVTNINGTIWMTTNLDLAGGTTLTAADSNVATSYTLPASSTSGFDDASVASVYNSGSTACGDNSPCYSYYNFAAATAGINPGSGESIYDICPKGWRLPTKSDFAALILLYPTSNDLGSAPWNGLYGGFYSPSTFNRGGVSSDYWSSTAENGSRANRLYFGASQTENSSYGKAFGFSVRCIAKKPYMQDYSYSELSGMLPNTGDSMVLYDRRDDESYNVAKLADGKIWLLDNLRLDLTDSTVQTNLTSSTTNASDNTLNYLKNGGGTTSDKYATAGVANWTSSHSYSAPLIKADYKDTTGTGGYEAGKYGVYYNYCAASAGSYCYGDGTSYGTPSGDATEDICPKGWRMPTGGSSGEYQALYTAYDSDYTSFVNALRTPLSGYFDSGSAYSQGSDGIFWSSTRRNDYLMRILYVYATKAEPQNNNYRYSGNSVRCILQ